jgi:ATP-dependent helicase YprA (DUF1998 family)
MITQRLQPFRAAEELKRAYRSYVAASFPLRRRELQERFDRLVDEERLLWQDPFVSLARSPRPGRSFAELEADGVIGPELRREVALGFERLHDHQSRAIERLSSRGGGRSTIVATGTGSGKTEAFLVPILDHCLREPGPGVKAIVLYPMNALANDQLKRLRRLLARTERVSFARYTGDTPHSEASALQESLPQRPPESPPSERYYRTEILEAPPDLLLTNYVMLELLLTRREDRERLLQGAPLRYLVVDEVHTFQGVRGTEVACLIRRLKEHVGLGRGRLICVGTSATLQRGGDPRALIGFARDLFGEDLDPEAVVTEEPLPLPETGPVPPPAGPIPEELLTADLTQPASLRALAEALLGENLGPVPDSELPAALYERTRLHPLFVELERHLEEPRPVASLVGHLRRLPGRQGLSDEELQREATAALLVGASALAPAPEGEEAEPRFRPKVHLVVRSLSPLAGCLDPTCRDLLADGRLECRGRAHPDLLRLALPLGVCRTCGQDYWTAGLPEPLQRQEREAKKRRRKASERVQALIGATLVPGGPPEVFLMPAEAAETEPGEDTEDEEDWEAEVLPAEEEGVFTLPLRICSACATLRRPEQEACPRCATGAPALPVRAFVGGTRCPRCLGYGTGRPIITPLRSGASSSVSVLTTELFDQLGDEERRTLIFADSRQDTAHQAGFLRERHQVFVRRQLLYQALREGGEPVALPDLATHVYRYAVDREGEAEALNVLLPTEVREATDRGFFGPDALPTHREVEIARRRLRWHCHLELTAVANQRNSLEREGLIGVGYGRLGDLAERTLPQLATFPGLGSTERVADLIAALLDVVRFNKAVAYPPFAEYLTERSRAVEDKEAVPARYLRVPVAFGPKRNRAQVYDLRAWYGARGRRTVVDDLVARLHPDLTAEQRHHLIDLVVEELRKHDFLTTVEIGRRQAPGRRVVTGLQLRPERIEVAAATGVLRCDRCQRATARPRRGAAGAVCLTYGCGGHLRPAAPDPAQSYYVHLYAERPPHPLHALEHSGQLPSQRRQEIERQFNAQQVNVLVCTPTLELGVDLPDLVALLLRNIPPTPANYAQRAGRAGRERRIALVVSHAGQGPHDAYFFREPAEMIAGEIRAPVLLLDNRDIVRRHVHSLILERLRTEIPGRWEEIADLETGAYRADLGARLHEELAHPPTREAIVAAVTRAFSDANLRWLDRGFVEEVIERFPDEVERGLQIWCQEYAELLDEHQRIKGRSKVNTPLEKRQMEQLERRMGVLSQDRDHNPLAFLASVGVLPRYGFPGDTVTVVDDRGQQISQRAAFGLTEYAPGNRVYVAGRRLNVRRVRFVDGAKENPRDHTHTYRYCDRCTYATESPFATTCPHCGGDGGDRPLRTGEYIDYRYGQALSGGFITDEDEYRSHESYDLATYVAPLETPADHERHEHRARSVGPLEVSYSRRRQIQIFNRGLAETAGTPYHGFMVCLVCGTYHSPTEQRRDQRGRPLELGTGHALSCPVAGWPSPARDGKENHGDLPEVEPHLHLRVELEGDLVEIALPPPVAEEYARGQRAWVVTLAHALKLGMELDMYVEQREIGHFTVLRRPPTGPELSLAFHDTLPGGTGYLGRLFERFGEVAAVAHHHLSICTCERACYRCLMQFWNQRDHALLDKRLVLPTLALLAEGVSTAPAPSISQRERFDSMVEAILFQRLRAAGMPRPRVREVLRDPSGRGILQMDLCWPDRQLAVLIDGREFHTATVDQVLADQDKRNRAIAAGERLLEFTGWEVLHHLDQVVAEIKGALEAGYEGATFVEGATLRAAEAPAGRVLVSVEGPLPAELAALGAEGFESKGRVAVGTTIQEALAVRRDPPTVILAVDVGDWLKNPAEWRRQLALMRALTVAGVRCYRLPSDGPTDLAATSHLLLHVLGIEVRS